MNIKLIICLFGVCTLLSNMAASAITPQKPNILLLVAEDMSPRVGAFGDSVARTPNLDDLARESIRYPNTFTTAGVCAPSRAALITGVHQIALGAHNMRTSTSPVGGYLAVPESEVKAFPELLRASGYYTYVTGKLDYQFSGIGAHTGPFTVWDKEGVAINWLPEPNQQPFFGMYHFGITHESQTFDDKYQQNITQGKVKNNVLADQVELPPYYPDTRIVRRDIARIYNNIEAMDRQVGKLLALLEEKRLAENTIVIWTSDHGDGLPRAKRELYDSGLKVPMLVRKPSSHSKTDNGDLDSQLISFVDIAPSILAMAGVTIPKYMNGKPRLAELSAPRRDYIYAAKDRLDEFSFRERAVRSHKYKYIRNYLPGGPGAVKLAYREQQGLMQELWRYVAPIQTTDASTTADAGSEAITRWFEPRPAEELYDIQADPFEVNNLAASTDHKQTLIEMRNALSDWLANTNDLGAIDEPDLAKRFWPGKRQPITEAPKAILLDDGSYRVESIEGASIGYRPFGHESWLLYQDGQSIAATADDKFEVKAIRYGYQESDVITLPLP